MSRQIDVLIAAYNESGIIAKTLRSIATQQLEDDCQFKIHVIANGCTDDTVEIAKQTIAELEPHPQLSFEVYVREKPHKIGALNEGLQRSEAPIVFSIDADAVLTPHCFKETLALFDDPGVMVGGPLPQFIVSYKNCQLLLGRIQRVANICYRIFECTTPSGCMIAFRRSFVNQFPTTIAGEDTWLAFHAAYQYGWQAVAITRKAEVHIVAPQQWLDYLKQESRFVRSTQQLLEVFPEFRAVRQAQQQLTKRLAVQHLTVVREQLKKERLQLVSLRARLLFQKMCQENASLMAHELLSPDNLWEPIVTTKKSPADTC
jgi:cellulose synthase/poly-beta-1,6-N-acetylglucosamine synthase-like glycosyltransferase